MKPNAGFTLIELLITITIMVVLLGLTVVSLRNNQASARDEERKSDVLAIAQQLENYYKSGSNAGAAYTAGEYPPTVYMSSETEVKKTLPDIDPAVLRAPDVAASSAMSFAVATSAATQSPTTSDYIYQPIDRNGALCDQATDTCSKFTLFYKLEGSSTVQTLTSRHQQ